MKDDLLCLPPYKEQASQQIRSFVEAITSKMERIKEAYANGKITYDQLVYGRTKLLQEASSTLFVSFNDPKVILEHITLASTRQKIQLEGFSVESFTAQH
ncbi:MAG: hypothetical protein J0I32_23390 [Sphingobacteriales bacterium]|nr:hypothetical protein [Sphingobacteriales bacterium]OJW01985.1 MAG: hypothetical protein BGO52_00440 [Sphingobacteriales bacterium 44-61]